MDEKMRKKFKEMIQERKNSPEGMAVIMSMVAMLEDDPRFEHLAELYDGMEQYGNFMTEKEARKIVDNFVNYDGSRGGKWTSIDGIAEEFRKFGGMPEDRGHYNRWVMYVLLNNAHSDYGGVIMRMTDGKDYVKTCYMMALAKLDDKDSRESIRKYFGLE